MNWSGVQRAGVIQLRWSTRGVAAASQCRSCVASLIVGLLPSHKIKEAMLWGCLLLLLLLLVEASYLASPVQGLGQNLYFFLCGVSESDKGAHKLHDDGGYAVHPPRISCSGQSLLKPIVELNKPQDFKTAGGMAAASLQRKPHNFCRNSGVDFQSVHLLLLGFRRSRVLPSACGGEAH